MKCMGGPALQPQGVPLAVPVSKIQAIYFIKIPYPN